MPATEPFGALLRRLRIGAGLSQERLAELAGISSAGVAALEAGRRTTPRLNTVGLLCDALSADGEQRSAMITAARPRPAKIASPDDITRSGGSRRVAPTETTRSSAFVGRQAELQLLHDAWHRRTRVALLFGEAGVGKSTLADEFAAQLGRDAVTVLGGRATAEQLGVFEVFVRPIKVALGNLRSETPAGLRELGRVVPGLIDAGAEPLVPGRTDPAVGRRLLFEAVGTLFGLSGPAVLVLDDLHWADRGSLELLTFVASLPELEQLMIVGTVRSTDVSASTAASLADLRRHCDVARINVAGLNAAELAELVRDVAGSHASESLISTVREATNGNPLFIRELTEHLLHNALDPTMSPSPVPDGIRDTLQHRLADLSADGQALLRGGAVLGQTFDLRLAGQLVGLTGEALLAAAEDALLSGLITEVTATAVTFSHGLVATAIYEVTPRLRRLSLHRAAAIGLAARQPRSAGEVVDVARHWSIVAADDPDVRATASDWSVRAGDAASAAASVDEAISCYRRAVAVWDRPSAEYADALMRLGSALTASGDVVGGNEALSLALETAERSGAVEVFAKAALGLSVSVRYTDSDPRRIAELEAAIAKVGPTEMVLRPALLATLKRQLGFVDTLAADRRRTEAAALVAAVVSQPDVSDELLISLGGLRDSLVLEEPEPLGDLARKIIRVASVRQDLPVLSTGWYRQGWSAIELGDGPLFREAVAEYRTIAQRLRRPYELAMSANMLAALAQIEGRHADAEGAGQEALAHASTIEDGNFGWVYFANAGLRAVDEGHATATFELMGAVRDEFAGVPTFEAGYAAIAAAAGQHQFAGRLCDEQIGEHGATLDANWSYLSAERLPVVGMLAWASALLDDTHRVSIMLDRVHRIAQLGVRAVRVAPFGGWLGPLDHHVGVLHRVLGDLDGAEQHLERALVVAEAMNGRPYRVRTLLELACVARSRAGTRAAALADRRQDEAQRLADELGLPALLAGTA